MELTGKCKEDFLDWWYDHEVFDEGWDILNVHNSLKYGVFLEFFDSKGISVDLNYYDITLELNILSNNRSAAINKANELYNNA